MSAFIQRGKLVSHKGIEVKSDADGNVFVSGDSEATLMLTTEEAIILRDNLSDIIRYED